MSAKLVPNGSKFDGNEFPVDCSECEFEESWMPTVTTDSDAWRQLNREVSEISHNVSRLGERDEMLSDLVKSIDRKQDTIIEGLNTIKVQVATHDMRLAEAEKDITNVASVGRDGRDKLHKRIDGIETKVDRAIGTDQETAAIKAHEEDRARARARLVNIVFGVLGGLGTLFGILATTGVI